MHFDVIIVVWNDVKTVSLSNECKSLTLPRLSGEKSVYVSIKEIPCGLSQLPRESYNKND